MGSSSSKFKKYLHHGDEFAAMQVFQGSPELQRNLNPNLSYGEHHNHDTALHFVAKHGMKHLLRTFLSDLGGNPNKKNGSNETSLHAACQLTNNKTFSAMERRAACVTFIMQWRGPPVESGGREKIDVAAQDQNGNTALHVAAASGLEHCVQTLISAGSPLFVENNDKMTPCDMAVKNGHHSIAQLLESKMVFGDSLDLHNEDELSQSVNETDEVYCGLRTQDLQEAKDQLLVETSDMLQVPLFTAEALLRDNEWSREILLDKWMKDAVACCKLAGVEPPQSAFNHGEVTLESVTPVSKESQDNMCDICMLNMKESDQPSVKISCNHNFCFQCWETYLSNKIVEGMQHNILCPAFNCHILVPIDVIERLVSPELAKRYLHFDIKAFVESNKSIKWCPVAGCGRAVRLPEMELSQPTDDFKNVPYGRQPPLTSHAVDCGNGHFFCWECLGEAHAPSGCSQWKQWLDKVNQIRPEQLSNDMKDLEDASNCLWLVSNSKPCPNCKSPIQKNEGCNHIKCSKCKFDFCWVCLEAWKKHSSATGGYFRCNRFPAASKADEKQGLLISEAVARSQQIQELNRFLHYYTRFKNHEHSRKLEESLLTAVKHKMEVLASAFANRKEMLSEKEKECTKFIEDGVRELLKARRVLCGSYVHGFFLDDHGYNKTIFEFMQNELETVTEKLSEMIARPYLKTPRHTIMQTTSLSRRKRHEFVRAVSKGLIPPETPPTFKKRKIRFPSLLVVDPNNEDDMSHVIVTSLKSLDTNAAWVKDDQSRVSHVPTIYEWPDFDSEDETEVSRALAVSLVGECNREGCNRPRARNPRTQALHEFCSLRCARKSLQVQSVTNDDNMDLIIALEMSRLQMIEDTIKRENQSFNKPNTSVSVTQTESDVDLNKAIELSIRQQKNDIGVTTEDVPALATNLNYFRKTNEDMTIDYFLKTLAGQSLHDIEQNSDSGEKDLAIFRPHRTEDGRFEISDIHETCFHQEDKDEQCLRRVRSTGDLCHKEGKKDQFREESRYHLDSDHSSQHDDKPEDIAQRILTFSGASDKLQSGQQFLTFRDSCGRLDNDENNKSKSVVAARTDSHNPGLEVCSILSFDETDKALNNDSFFMFKMSSKFHNALDQIIADPTQRENLQPVQNPTTNDHIKQPNLKKLRSSLEDKVATPSDKNPQSKLGPIDQSKKSDVDLENKSESVKNLIEEVQNTLKSIECESKVSCLTYVEAFSGPICSTWQNSVFDFDNAGTEFLRHCPERASTGKIKNNKCVNPCHSRSTTKSATALEHMNDSEKQLISTDMSKKLLFVGSEKNINEAHKKAFKAAGGKIFNKKGSKSAHSSREGVNKSNSNLRIRISKSPSVTDSSNEYETDTGIPKSPTLFISGVSISRTPEPCGSTSVKEKKSPEHKKTSGLKSLTRIEGKNNSSPMLNLIPPTTENVDMSIEVPTLDGNALPSENLIIPDKFLNCGRQSRSSSWTVPRADVHKDSIKKTLNASCGAILSSNAEKKLSGRKCGNGQIVDSFSTRNTQIRKDNDRKKESDECVFNFPGFCQPREPGNVHESKVCFKTLDRTESSDGNENYRSISIEGNLADSAKTSGKSMSASEPEREREVFRFPKSSTDGALSSVLHVQESNLSSDDFHEVLFLLERSPKHGSKRKKKSKKERDKVKENSAKDKCPDVSSVL
ncbi:hypothetical protein RUM43_012883 [Polyplax serrata]|uniref:RBR-type E3 ubiquitin transferase n=1 Tax=Polyplax serrata TaxID=468196 RepID=A0AAN8PTT3_POLSC